jgi:hypothetical protein
VFAYFCSDASHKSAVQPAARQAWTIPRM